MLDPQANSVTAKSRHQWAVFAEGISRNLRRRFFCLGLKGGVRVYRTEVAGKDIGDREQSHSGLPGYWSHGQLFV